MEDSCAVCAEPLEWIGYGPCNHREVCFICLARLRFALKDKRCCICRAECPTIYVTKALGENTIVVTDWTPLLNHSNSLRQGSLWYYNVVEAYFDDEEPFQIIRATWKKKVREAIDRILTAAGLDTESRASTIADLCKRNLSRMNVTTGINRILNAAEFNHSLDQL